MREKGWNIVGRVKNPVPPLQPGRIGAGSRVTFVDRFGDQRTGTAVMLGPAGWVLNMGGRHGTPAVVKFDSIVKVVNPRRKANPSKKAALIRRTSKTSKTSKTRRNPVYNPSACNPSEVLAAMKLEYEVLARSVNRKIPVSSIQKKVDAMPVSTTFRAVEEAIRAGVRGAPGWTANLVQEAVAVAIARHRLSQAKDQS